MESCIAYPCFILLCLLLLECFWTLRARSSASDVIYSKSGDGSLFRGGVQNASFKKNREENRSKKISSRQRLQSPSLTFKPNDCFLKFYAPEGPRFDSR